MDRAAFYTRLRARDNGVFGTSLSQRQVEALEALLDEGQGLSLPHFAHVLGEVYHETQGGMYPVKETVFAYHNDQNPSDAEVIARLDRAWSKGQLPWVKTPYWRDGAFGRGGIQLTWWDNYVKLSPHVGVNLREEPDAALDPVISARIAIKGCALGLFRGKKLSDYDGETYDHVGARDIVNGDTRANGPKVAVFAKAFEDALRAAGYDRTPAAPADPGAMSYADVWDSLSDAQRKALGREWLTHIHDTLAREAGA